MPAEKHRKLNECQEHSQILSMFHPCCCCCCFQKGQIWQIPIFAFAFAKIRKKHERLKNCIFLVALCCQSKQLAKNSIEIEKWVFKEKHGLASSSEGESGSGQCSKVFSGPVGRTLLIVIIITLLIVIVINRTNVRRSSPASWVEPGQLLVNYSKWVNVFCWFVSFIRICFLHRFKLLCISSPS